MPGAVRAGSYAALLRRPGVARTFALALTGRLAYGVLPLILLFTVRQSTGSFAVAASSAAVFGLAATAMPLQARAIDRWGQRRVLPCAGCCFVAVLTALAALAAMRADLGWGWLVLAAALGLCPPALGPSMRAQWRVLAADDLTAAYALDAVCEEALYLLGPLVAGAILALGPAWTGLPLMAVLLAVGIVGLTTSAAAVGPGPAARSGGAAGALRHRRLRGLLVAVAVFGTASGSVPVLLAARAQGLGHPAYTGLGETAVAIGSVSGGLAWGRLRPPGGWRRQLTVLIGGVVVTVVVAHLLPLAATVVLVVVAGAASAPVYVVAYRVCDTLVDDTERTEASVWVTTAINLGIAAGTALAGVLAR